MTISPHSNVSPIQPQPLQNNVPSSKTQPPQSDTVQLSAAATSKLKSGVADGDGDGH